MPNEFRQQLQSGWPWQLARVDAARSRTRKSSGISLPRSRTRKSSGISLPRSRTRKSSGISRRLKCCHFSYSPNCGRAGLTLIELLVVVTILLLLMGVAVPLMKPALQQGRLREAARQVNAYFAVAKARAVQLGRPAGVWLERSEAAPNACFDLFLAEMPPAYSGDTLGATVRFAFDQTLGKWVADQRTGVEDPRLGYRFEFSETMHGMLNPASNTVFSGALIKPGETFFIQFNFKGRLYQVQRSLQTPALFILEPNRVKPNLEAISPPPGARFHLNAPDPGVPFQVFRAPVRTSGRSMQMGGGAVIDLENSGFGLDGRDFDSRLWQSINPVAGRMPVVIMFFPGGGVERVVGGGVSQSPLSTIHLLIGTFDGLQAAESTPETPNDIPMSAVNTEVVRYNQNLQNLDAVWISIGHRTGTVSSSENGWLLSGDDSQPYFLSSLRAAREFAQSSQTLGGR